MHAFISYPGVKVDYSVQKRGGGGGDERHTDGHKFCDEYTAAERYVSGDVHQRDIPSIVPCCTRYDAHQQEMERSIEVYGLRWEFEGFPELGGGVTINHS